MLALDFFVLLDALLQVVLKILLDVGECVMLLILLERIVLFLEQLFLDVPNLLLLALHVAPRNISVDGG